MDYFKCIIFAFSLCGIVFADDYSSPCGKTAEEARKYIDSRSPPKKAEVPKPGEIIRARAEVYQNLLGKEDIDGIVVPADKVDYILELFSHSEVDIKPFGDTYEIGTIRLDLKGGRVIRYCWYWYAPREAFTFSCNGIRYKSLKTSDQGDPAFTLDEFLRKLHAVNLRANNNDK